jgi:uncharacterized protein YjbJ (UPF0337 family)
MMKPSTDDKTTGKIHQVKGTIKEKVGELTNNPDLEADGRAEKNAGKVQNWIGKVEKRRWPISEVTNELDKREVKTE